MKEHNSDLTIGFGKPEHVVLGIVKSLLVKGDSVQGVYMQREVRSTGCASIGPHTSI